MLWNWASRSRCPAFSRKPFTRLLLNTARGAGREEVRKKRGKMRKYMQTSVQKRFIKDARVRTATWPEEGRGEQKRGKNAQICREAFKNE
jgi:hypothetical protein